MMLAEVQRLFEEAPAESGVDAYREAVVNENVLGKATAGSRERAFRALRELYALDPRDAAFRVLRFLWDQDPAGRPPMALLQVLRRDRLLRATAATILTKPEGAPVSATELSAAFMPLHCRARSNGPGGGTLGVPSCRIHVGGCRRARSRMKRGPACVAKMVPTEPAGRHRPLGGLISSAVRTRAKSGPQRARPVMLGGGTLERWW
jgi:hypothetical protein